MKRFAAIAAVAAAIVALSAAQSTTINGGRVIRGVWDASTAAATKPARAGTVLPADCDTGEAFFKTDAQPGANLYLCTAAGVWSEAGWGAASGAGQLRDFAVTRTSGTVLTVAYTGAVRFGNHTCPAPGAPSTVTIASGSGIAGTARLYVTPSCALTWGLNVTDTTKVACDQNCAIVDGVAAFPSDAVPLFEWNASAGQWNAAGNDLRAFLSSKASRAAAQGGLAVATQPDGADEFSVDASVVSTFSSGTVSPPASCGVGQKYIKTDTNQSYECTSTNTWTEAAGGGNSGVRSPGITIDGGGSVITAGVKGYLVVPYACAIAGWDMVADQSGSITIDVWKAASAVPVDANSITASAQPSMSAGQLVVNNTALTGWTTSISADDVLGFNVDSASTVTRVTFTLRCR